MADDAGRGEYVEPPTVYDVVELPSAQKFKGCQLWPDGESRCDRGAEYVFVYAASAHEDDDRRRNAVACGECCPKVSTEAKRDSELATDGGRETTHIDEDDGLWIPPRLREFEGQVVFRTPRTTIQHFESGGGQLDAYYPMVDERDFGDTDEMTNPKNPGLAPRTVSIKPQGEDPVELTVSFPQEQLADGAGEPDSINEFALAGDFGFMRVEGPFEVDKSGTNWTIFLPENPDNRVVRTLDEDDEGLAGVLVADCEVVGGGIVTNVWNPEGEDGRRLTIDQYARGGER